MAFRSSRAFRATAIAFSLALALALALALPSAQAYDKAYDNAVAACRAKPAASTLYVSASSARLRRLPDAEAPLVQTLPIGTEAQIECKVGAWVRANVQGNAPAVGWIRADLLQAQRPTVDSLSAEYARAGTGNRKTIAERAVALAPFDARSHQLLIDALRARGDKNGAQQATALRDRIVNPRGERLANEPATVFVVENGLVTPLVIVDGANAYRDASTWSAKDGQGMATSPYLKQWRGLHFYRRGGADGVVQLLETPTPDGIGFHAAVRQPPSVVRDGELTGIASNTEVTQAPAPAPVQLSRSERQSLDRELKRSLQKQGVGSRTIAALFDVAQIAEDGLGVRRYALPQSGNAKPLLIATATWRIAANGDDMEAPLLDAVIVLEADKKGRYKPSKQFVQQTAGDGIQQHNFIDHLDIDKDGTPELIFSIGEYEGSEYEIWSRRGGEWHSVFKGAYSGA